MMDWDKALKEYFSGMFGNNGAEKTTGIVLAEPPATEQKEQKAQTEPTRIKLDPVRVFNKQQQNYLSDKSVDCRNANAVNVAVIVNGTNPSATILVEGSQESGGNYILLDDPKASRTVTANTNWNVMVGTAWTKIRIANISGTFASGEGFTIIVTPFVAAGPVSTTLYNSAGTELGTSTTPLPVVTSSITAAKLQKGAQTRTSITCTVADTDYAAGAVIPAGTKYIVVWAVNAFVVAVDEATSASVGIGVQANNPQTFPVSFGAGDSLVHVQSSTAGTVVNIAYLKD